MYMFVALHTNILYYVFNKTISFNILAFEQYFYGVLVNVICSFF